MECSKEWCDEIYATYIGEKTGENAVMDNIRSGNTGNSGSSGSNFLSGNVRTKKLL